MFIDQLPPKGKSACRRIVRIHDRIGYYNRPLQQTIAAHRSVVPRMNRNENLVDSRPPDQTINAAIHNRPPQETLQQDDDTATAHELKDTTTSQQPTTLSCRRVYRRP